MNSSTCNLIDLQLPRERLGDCGDDLVPGGLPAESFRSVWDDGWGTSQPGVPRLTKALHVASGWSSDQSGHGLALLSLGTTRRIHTEDHRTKALAEIDASIHWNRAWAGTPNGVNDPTRDIPALEDLRKLVVDATIGAEWLSDVQNLRFTEELYQTGKLD